MAAVTNSFDALIGAEATLNKKKKKQNKPKENGSGLHENGSGPGQESSRAGGNSANHDPSRPVDVDEAVATFEQAAREARSISDKAKLWKDWIRQAGDRSAKSIKYRDLDAGNALLDFRQVLLKSRALEISLESAVGAGLGVEREELLTQLLLTFSARLDGRSAQTLANAIVHLSTLTEDESLDVKGCAQRAVYSIVGSIKGPASPEAAAGAADAAVSLWMDRVSSLGQTIAKEQGMLQKLATAGRAPSREAEIARKIFRLTGEQFDLLQTEALPTPAGGSADSYTSAIGLLKTAISSKIQAVSGDKPKAGKGNDAANKQQALASLKREEAVVSQQAESVAAQIRTLEAQLRTLRGQQQELDDKRSQLQQRMRLANDPTGQGKKGAAHHQEELAVVDTIHTVLLSTDSHSAEADQIHAVQSAGMNVGAEYVAAGRQYLTFARTAMGEVPQKVTFCKQRLAQAERLLKLGSKDNQKIKDDADKLMAETIKNAEELLRTSVQVVSELNGRFEAVMRSLPDQEAAGVSDALRSVDELMADIRSNYEAVQSQIRPPAPAPVPVATAAPVANGKGAHHAPVARPVSAAPVVSAPVVAPLTCTAPPQFPHGAPVAGVGHAPVSEGPKNAFDVAAAYLASARPISAPVRSESPAAVVRKAPAPVANRPTAAPVAANTSSAPRQWGKPAGTSSSTSADAGDSLPTPAEAFKVPTPAGAPAPGPSATPVEGTSQPKKRNNRPKA